MTPDNTLISSAPFLSIIAWLYLATNSARAITYVPQIVAVWRCTDGAQAISLLTWWSWVLSHATGALYGALVIHDGFFVGISILNVVCCSLVALIAARRRGQFALRSVGRASLTVPVVSRVPSPPPSRT